MTAPLALSCGEPAGVGPEVAAKAYQALKPELALFWIGDPDHLPPSTPVRPIGTPDEAADAMSDGLPVLARKFPAPARPGRPAPENARHVIEAILEAVDLTRSGAAGGVVTAPISKKVLIDGAGFAFPGHTEYLSSLAGNVPVAMMLACEGLRVVPATIHIPIADVPARLTAKKLTETLRITRTGLMRNFGIAMPRIAVAGLNPHAGEAGAMGREEIDLILPVLDSLRAEGFDIAGPLPADTMFHATARARYDVAVAMYHDQALIPIKTIDFAGGVNVTLGLPFIRTSPDHGTAFDIAGTGQADPTSMIAAIRMAAEMAATRG